MKKTHRITILFSVCCFLFSQTPLCQQAVLTDAKNVTKKTASLFSDNTVLSITLRGDIRRLMNDRDDDPQNHKVQVVYKTVNNTDLSLSTSVKTRGHFRKKAENCEYPPLLINFSKGEALNASLFKDYNKCKLVMPCQGDEYVVREWLVYRIYNLVTPKSFQARLVEIQLDDPKSKKNPKPFYGILLEDDKKMAKRNNTISIEKKLRPEHTEPDAFLKMAVFEYLIGNTDWSVQFMQNIKFIARDSISRVTTVPYDFDHSGLVNAPYAYPAEELMMRNVEERRYRGYCVKDMKKFDAAVALFNRIKKDLYQLYTDCNYIDEKYKKSTLKYFDEFYATINNPEALQKEFGYPCDPNGTGNIVIKGLREN
jgi:hypothetical protein